VVEVTRDPDDGRAKRVTFSARGLRAMQDGLAALGAVEAELAAVVGPKQMRALHAILDAIVIALEAAPPVP
jgi:DNA-binding MarR family transcriptional regulator